MTPKAIDSTDIDSAVTRQSPRTIYKANRA